jgi:hypothetical protein
MPFNINVFRSSFGDYEPQKPNSFEVFIQEMPAGMAGGIPGVGGGGIPVGIPGLPGEFGGIPGAGGLLIGGGAGGGVLGGADWRELMTFRCMSSQLPGENIATAERKTNGSPRKVGYGLTELDLSMTVILSASMMERDFFVLWQDLVYNKEFQNPYYYDDYIGSVIIRMFSHTGEISAEYELMEAYPISVSPVELSWDSQNQMATFNVEWSYRKWEQIL